MVVSFIAPVTSLVCVPHRTGRYEITPNDCIQFEQPSYEFATAAPAPLVLAAARVRIHGRVRLPQACPGLLVRVAGDQQIPTEQIEDTGVFA